MPYMVEYAPTVVFAAHSQVTRMPSFLPDTLCAEDAWPFNWPEAIFKHRQLGLSKDFTNYTQTVRQPAGAKPDTHRVQENPMNFKLHNLCMTRNRKEML
jgi:hypothetical protein